ncbi:MAG TPA: hypothetical protein VFC33_15140 [Acidimicrobiia bacterium]|nr:hypothetical protein [Acidimicrobiia bacterium]
MLVIGVAGLAVAVVALVTASVAVRSRRRLAARVEAVARQQAQLGTHLARLNDRLLDLEEGRRSESGAERERARVRVELARTASGTHEVALVNEGPAIAHDVMVEHANGDPLAWEPLPVRSLLAGARFGFAVDGHLDGPLDCVLRWHDGGGAHRVPVRLAAT